MHIIYGIIGIVLGVLIVIYSYPIKRFTGSMGWAEKLFGVGGTATGIKVIGILVSVFSFLWMTGTLGDVLRGFLGPFIGSQQTVPSGIINLFL